MFDLIVNFIAVYALGFYLITVLQWYNYKANRIIFHFHKYRWHFFYVVIPVITYIFAYRFFWIYLFFGYIPALIFWFNKTKKPLKFTSRVKRFLIILGFTETFALVILHKTAINPGYMLIVVLMLAIIISEVFEEVIFLKFKKHAKKKLQKISPKMITITGSYGKTSIKNFIYQFLKNDFDVYKTPRSVNTLKGIVLDINTNLPENTKIYITEAGAREKGDIKEIVRFLENDYSILGKIGPQHIEYFKTLENIKKVKSEIFLSPKLKKAFTYDIPHEKSLVLIDKIKNIKADLNGTKWDLEIDGRDYEFETKILGAFNAVNISLAIYQSYEFIKDIAKLQEICADLEPIPHRLQKIEVGGKTIIDDSFNGNIEGMLQSFEIMKLHPGRKIIVTPGLAEADKEMNEKLAREINKTFDLAIITGESNRKILSANITIEKITLQNKSRLEKLLSDVTGAGDLILFANDFPDYL